MSFVSNRISSTIPFYFTLTDTTVVSAYTSAVDYTRIWSITNINTSAIEFFTTTSASINYCVSAGSIINDAYTISLSAVV